MLRLFFALALLLGGCAPLDLYYREGADVSHLHRDETRCEVSALRDAPVANRIQRTAGRFVPARRVCDANGVCTTYNGFWEPGEIITIDVNADLRRRVYGQCMGDRGYFATRIPACPAGIARSAPPATTQVLPRLTPRSCVIRNRGGGWQIVNQG